MFYRKKIKELNEVIDALINKSQRLDIEIQNLNSEVNSYKEGLIRSAIGFPDKESKRLDLLRQARDKGFFDYNSVFTSAGYSPEQGGLYRHNSSGSLSNYRLFVDCKSGEVSLSIPAIGVGDNFSCGGCVIYSRGVWATVVKNKCY
jgi:hypothetical protein